MVSHDFMAAQQGSLYASGQQLRPSSSIAGAWRLAACSGNVLFLSAVVALQPRVQWTGRTAEALLSTIADQSCCSLLLIATDDPLDLAILELLPLLRERVHPGRLQVVLFLEDHLDQGHLQNMKAAGANVLCRMQRFQGPMLASAINTALLNRPWIDPLFADLPPPAGAPTAGRPQLHPWDLGSRERELLRQVGQGYNALEISRQLGIRCDTVRRTLSRVYKRIGVRDRAQAVGWCLCHGLISRQELSRRYLLSTSPQEQSSELRRML